MCTLIPFEDRLICAKCLKFSFTPTKPTPLVCCGKKMQIQEDTSAICLRCNKIIFNAVPCATIEQYFANGGRKRTPYRRIHYFREWMSYIQGHRPVFFDNETKKKIINNLEEPTLQGLKKTLKKLKLGKY